MQVAFLCGCWIGCNQKNLEESRVVLRTILFKICMFAHISPTWRYSWFCDHASKAKM